MRQGKDYGHEPDVAHESKTEDSLLLTCSFFITFRTAGGQGGDGPPDVG